MLHIPYLDPNFSTHNSIHHNPFMPNFVSRKYLMGKDGNSQYKYFIKKDSLFMAHVMPHWPTPELQREFLWHKLVYIDIL